jgi:hypothetical protein
MVTSYKPEDIEYLCKTGYTQECYPGRYENCYIRIKNKIYVVEMNSEEFVMLLDFTGQLYDHILKEHKTEIESPLNKYYLREIINDIIKYAKKVYTLSYQRDSTNKQQYSNQPLKLLDESGSFGYCCLFVESLWYERV